MVYDVVSDDDLAAAFRKKASAMMDWKPGSAPSNRDKLELYALHKQAVSGDAPESLATQSAAERAKYQAWRGKSGLSQQEAMRLYLQEGDRQIRVYGRAPNALENSQPQQTSHNTQAALEDRERGDQLLRGLAAIPLLCAAASESRQAYLRRLANTSLEQAWWGRQEPLTAAPGSLFSLPESILIGFAALLERISLTADSIVPIIPIDVVRSFLWPSHNSLLALWMAYILNTTAWSAAIDLTQTIVWGSRRTGLSLESAWKEQVIWCARSVRTLTEPHQPLTARIMGLSLWPYGPLVNLANAMGPVLWKATFYVAFLCCTWWFWWVVLPWLGLGLMSLSFLAGNCFCLIELAGV